MTALGFRKGVVTSLSEIFSRVPYSSELEASIRIAREAGSQAFHFFQNFDALVTVESKGPSNPVTNADKQVNEYVMAQLSAQFPDDIVCAEESASLGDTFLSLISKRVRKRVWFVDPIDGTAEFAAKREDWCVMIGLASTDATPLIGVCYCPVQKWLYFGGSILGGSFFVDEAKSTVDAECIGAVAEGAGTRDETVEFPLRLFVSRSHYDPRYEQLFPSQYSLDAQARSRGTTAVEAVAREEDHEYAISVCDYLVRRGLVGPAVPRNNLWQGITIGSLGLKACLIAHGRANLYFNVSGSCSLWDLCGPEAILTAAGAAIVKFDGSRPVYDGREACLQQLPKGAKSFAWTPKSSMESFQSPFLIASNNLLASIMTEYFEHPRAAAPITKQGSLPLQHDSMLFIGSGNLTESFLRYVYSSQENGLPVLSPFASSVTVTSRNPSSSLRARYAFMPPAIRFHVEKFDCSHRTASDDLAALIEKRRTTVLVVCVAPSREDVASQGAEAAYTNCYLQTAQTVSDAITKLAENGFFTCSRIVYVSSTSVYPNSSTGDQPVVVHEDDAPIDSATLASVSSRILRRTEAVMQDIPARIQAMLDVADPPFSIRAIKTLQEQNMLQPNTFPRVSILRLGEILDDSFPGWHGRVQSVLSGALQKRCGSSAASSPLSECSRFDIARMLVESSTSFPMNVSPMEDITRALGYAVMQHSSGVWSVTAPLHEKRRQFYAGIAVDLGLLDSVKQVEDAERQPDVKGLTSIHGGNRIVDSSKISSEWGFSFRSPHGRSAHESSS
eukprot:ANDGO_00344.mRNA.1 3'(2')